MNIGPIRQVIFACYYKTDTDVYIKIAWYRPASILSYSGKYRRGMLKTLFLPEETIHLFVKID